MAMANPLARGPLALSLFLILAGCSDPAPPAPSGNAMPSPSEAELAEVSGAAAKAWVRGERARAESETGPPEALAQRYGKALEALERYADALPKLSLSEGRVTTLEKSQAHPRGRWGILDGTALAAGERAFTPLLDLDALSAVEGENWTYHHSSCRPAPETRCLLFLSPDGGDATVLREFDLADGAFVADGFRLPKGKMTVRWAGPDALYVATDRGPGSLTRSGYAREVALWPRGTAFAEAPVLHEASEESVRAYARRLEDDDGTILDLLVEVPSFFEADFWRWDGAAKKRLPLPSTARLHGLLAGQLIVELRRPWTAEGKADARYPAGTLLAVPSESPELGAATVLFAPSQGRALEDLALGKGRLWLHVLDEGVSTLESLSAPEGAGPWARQAIDLGDPGALAFLGTDRSQDALWVTHEGFLSPPTLARVSGNTFSPALQAPALFDATAFKVERRQARSVDGTTVPYWLVGPKDKLPRPTHLFAYGGFANTLMPSYAGTYEATPGVYGRLWLEEGGRFVVPNLRGGGLYGPAWHQAALGPNRIKSFEDLEAVVDDLTGAGLTTPAQMSIEGRSNGGLLVFAALTRRPQGYGAIVSGVPLADMLRYHTLLAGASWTGEYGDPRDPAARAWLEAYSPYQQLQKGASYAPTFIYGSAGDDRVHPAHGRWMAAKLKALGAPVWYWETEDGGHGNPVRREDLAQRLALTYSHLWKHLGAAPPLGEGAP